MRNSHFATWSAALTATLLLPLAWAPHAQAEEGSSFGHSDVSGYWTDRIGTETAALSDNRADGSNDWSDDCRCRYGLKSCVSRGTLFQWSYRTSFSGGPDLDSPLVTDRPDFTEASSTVGRGISQLEFGYTYVYDANDGTSTREQSFGEPLLRYGILADWLEFRIALFPLQTRITTAGRSNSTAGTDDLYLGLKIGLTPQEGILPEMALIPQTLVPTGSNAFTNDELLPGVNWVYAWELNDVISTGGSTQINRRIDETTDAAYLELAQSWTIAYTLTDQLGAYTEWFALIPHSAETDPIQHFFNGGFTYLINDDVQFDIRAGLGLNDAAAEFFLGTGLSIRFK